MLTLARTSSAILVLTACMHPAHLRKHIASQFIRRFDKAFGWREMVNKHDIARLRKLNTSFRIATNDSLCDTDSAHGMVKRVYSLWQAAWLANTDSLEWLVWRSLYWHLGPGSWVLKGLVVTPVHFFTFGLIKLATRCISLDGGVSRFS